MRRWRGSAEPNMASLQPGWDGQTAGRITPLPLFPRLSIPPTDSLYSSPRLPVRLKSYSRLTLPLSSGAETPSEKRNRSLYYLFSQSAKIKKKNRGQAPVRVLVIKESDGSVALTRKSSSTPKPGRKLIFFQKQTTFDFGDRKIKRGHFFFSPSSEPRRLARIIETSSTFLVV